MKRKKNVFLYGLLYFFSLIIIIVGGAYLYYTTLTTTDNKQEITIDIPKGYNSDKIANLLKEKGVINSTTYFKIEVMRTGSSSKFKSGRYLVPPKQNVDELITRIALGDHLKLSTIKVTIPEGFTLEQIANRLESKKLVNKEEFLNVAYQWNGDEWFLKDIPIDKHRLDGFLFPETYEFYEGTTSNEIITTMLTQFDKVFSKYKDKISQQKLSTREIVTLASLIEKEAKYDEDRTKISSVIYNRLKTDMLLQIDATVLTAVGHKEKVTYEDLKVDSPYNTYKYKGLTPSPIASPGEKSIDAAFHPAETSYIYYVVDKKTGLHRFSKTLDEHNKNIEKYYK